MTGRRALSGALVGWTLLAIVLWVVTGWLEARDSCETDYELFCLHKGEIWLLLRLLHRTALARWPPRDRSDWRSDLVIQKAIVEGPGGCLNAAKSVILTSGPRPATEDDALERGCLDGRSGHVRLWLSGRSAKELRRGR